MTEKESYIQGQKASGIEVGDKVRVVRAAEDYEDGWQASWNGSEMEVGKEWVVKGRQGNEGFNLHEHYVYPYFVLEIVKKADGNVPGKVKDVKVYERCLSASEIENLYSGDSNMKTQEIYKYAVTENVKIKDDNGQIESIKKNLLSSGTLAAYDEANAKIKALQGVKLDGIDLDEVEVLVRPFCG